MYEFRTDDLFYDIESLENIFTCSHWYPAQNRLDVFYKMDITPNGPEKEIIENLTEEKVRKRVLLRNPNVREKNITVNLKDLDDPQAITDFIKVYGISLKQEGISILSDEAPNTQIFILNTSVVFSIFDERTAAPPVLPAALGLQKNSACI